MRVAQEQHLEEGQDDASRGTLGAVLYADRSQPPVSERDWAALVESIAAGDQLALHALYERTHRIVFTLIVRIAGNRETAEEVTLDVFHDVWRHASRYDARNGTVVGWVMNQARSRALDRLRFENRKKRTDPGTGDCVPAIEADDSHGLEHRQQRRALRLNQPLGTVKTRIRSGLHKLRQALASQAGNS